MRLSDRLCGGERGLTLIELMIVVAVLAILATIVVPTYERYMTSVRRADGRAAITDVALAEERFISVYQTYTDDFTQLRDRAGLDASLVKDADEGVSPKLHYTLAVTATTTNFTITATRVPTGADSDCTAMTLTSAGKKDGAGADKTKCW
jgi:type IV pilus assembly protein PilE